MYAAKRPMITPQADETNISRAFAQPGLFICQQPCSGLIKRERKCSVQIRRNLKCSFIMSGRKLNSACHPDKGCMFEEGQ